MYKILIFGTGLFYQNRKIYLTGNEIIGFIDNAVEKQNQMFDGHYVYSVHDALKLDYDYIVLMSKDRDSMYKQLCALGVKEKNIIPFEEYSKIKKCTEMKIYSVDGEGISQAAEQENMVLLISHELSNTGAPIVLLYMAILLRKNGYTPVILSRKEGALKRRILEERISLIIYPDNDINEFLLNLILKQSKAVVCNTLELGGMLEHCAKYCRKVVWWVHESKASYRDVTIPYCQKQYAMNVITYAVSQYAARFFEKHSGGNHIKGILPYGIPDKEISGKKMGGKPIFAVIGVLSARKGQDVFLQAIRRLPNEQREAAEFWIIGKESDFTIDDLKAIFECGEVKYLGEVASDKMQELYEEIDVVVCPSRDDPLPVVLTEGFMNRKVCIMSDNTGTADLVTDLVNGLVCETENAEHLAEKIKWVLEHKDNLTAIKENGRKLYQDVFSMEGFERRILSLIED